MDSLTFQPFLTGGSISVQLRLLPKKTPKVTNYHFEAEFQPARDLGGDFYSFVPFSDGRIGIILADAVGKGVAAALIVSNFKTLSEQYINPKNTPKKTLSELNQILYDSSLYEKYLPVIYGILDPQKNTFTYCNAGHEQGLHYSNDLFKSLKTGGPPLGMSKNDEYEEEVIQLKDKDILVLFTDGLNEAKNSESEEFGNERIQNVLKNYANTTYTSLTFTQSLLEHWEEFRNPLNKHVDDMTFIMIERQSNLPVKK